MKKLLLGIALFPALALANGTVYLAKYTGRLAKHSDQEVKICTVRDLSPELQKLAYKTKNEPFKQLAVYVQANVPSVENVVYLPKSATVSKEVLLLADYSDRSARVGEASDQLNKILDERCP